MSAIPPRMRIGAFVLLAWMGLAGGTATLGQNPPAPGALVADPAKPAARLTPARTPISYCMSCHNEKPDAVKVPGRICQMTEFETWNLRDKHKRAYEILTQQRAKDIGAGLGIPQVTESVLCTNCHGTNVPGARESAKYPFKGHETENGVSCIACHGPYNEWIREHALPDTEPDPDPNKPNWTNYNRIEKEQRYGMKDLWNPITRAAKCASCHIGNPEELKVITHNMYAAGHPPLPSFEAATFSEAQPKHWQYIRDKSDDNKKRLTFKEGKREQTELVVASGIVALREAMHLYAKEAGDRALQKQLDTHWPDFARFDCSACHHDLKVPSWRQQRGYPGRAPGRATTPVWPDVLVELGITVAGAIGGRDRSSEYSDALKAFQHATTASPFGDPDRSAAAANALAAWADAVGEDLSKAFANPAKVVINDKMALDLLRQLAKMAATRPLDFDTARQIAWAFKIIYEEAEAMDPSAPKESEMKGLIKSLFDNSKLPLPGAKMQVAIDDSLGERLKAVVDFDPDVFRADFTKLALALASQAEVRR